MNFVTPGLLLGAVFVAVPIVLHLIMRRQPAHLEFPALRFLQLRREANRRRLRLRHLLLLALRAAAIALLAAALARPSIKGSGFLGGEEAPVAATFLFDTTPSMDYRHENRTRLEAAQELGVWLLTQLPPESEITVLDCGAAQPAFGVERGAAKGRVERLRVTPIARSLPDVLELALDGLSQSDPRRHEIFVFTDMTESAWTTSSAQRLREQLDAMSNLGIYLIDVGVSDPRNFALGEVRLSSETLAQQSPLFVSTELIRSGPEDRRGVELFVLDGDGQPRKRGEMVEDWRPGERRRIEFRVTGLETGTHQGFLRIVGEDPLAWDDMRYFTVEVRPAWQVLVIASQVENSIYLTQAIAPESFRESGQSRFQPTVVGLEKLNQQRLGDYAAVVLLDPAPLNEAAWQQLADYATQGGAVAIFLGAKAHPVDAFNTNAAQLLLPGLLKRQWRATTYLAPRDLHHPMLARFRPLENSIPWRAFPVLRYWQLDELADGVNQIMPYASGHPAIVEKPLGRGRVLTMTTPISDPANLTGRDPWNLLPTGIEPWPFVMLANETMLYLVGSREEQFNYLAGQTAVLRASGAMRPTMVSLTTPRGDQIRQTVDPRQNSIVVTSTDAPGNYRVQAGGREAGLDRGFSVNLASQFSRLERVDHKELESLLGKQRLRIATNRDEIDRNVNIGRVGRELFGYIIALVAVLLGLEHVLANRFYRRQA